MTGVQVFEIEVANGKQYVNTVFRGVQYTLCNFGDNGWTVWSHRKASSFSPRPRNFETLGDVAKNVKAFEDFFGIDCLQAS